MFARSRRKARAYGVLDGKGGRLYVVLEGMSRACARQCRSKGVGDAIGAAPLGLSTKPSHKGSAN